jgi:hypothetical protein
MNNKDKLIVFLDTSVLLKAFVGYRQNHKPPLFMDDRETKRFTFEKCIYEAYMAFRGIGGKKPSEGRGDWASRFLNGEDDPKSLDKLASKFHDDSMAVAFFWANHILGVNPENYIEAISSYIRPDEAEEAYQSLDELSTLKNQRRLFEVLCDDFRQMLRENNIIELSYTHVFSDDDTWANNLGVRLSNLDSYTLDLFVRRTVIPSEDFENIFAASLIYTDIFVTDDDKLTRCAWSLGVNLPLSPAAFCRSEEYESKKQECKSGSVFAEPQNKK